MREARHWKRLEEGRVQCRLCPHACALRDGEAGLCKARKVQDGVLMALTYGQIAAVHIDPMEKKPLYHFLPGREILSVGMNGCNLSCAFCQNWRLSQAPAPTQDLPIEGLVAMASDHACPAVAFTYSEPLVAFEYVIESCEALSRVGVKNVLVTNGFILPEPLAELLPHVHAANVDLKSIRDAFYQKVCGGRVEPVKQTLKSMKGRIHVEVTNLLVTDENDSEEDVGDLVDWVADELGQDTPLHLSRYFPQFKFRAPPTPLKTLERAYRQAKKRLAHVYVGNAQIAGSADTICPSCRNVVVSRVATTVNTRGMDSQGRCRDCGQAIMACI